ncbi:MFS transporter [Geothrix edaphica]|uniref:Lysosomal dipeptide transporter MFSD1 n=1 Tax=Geothrix edaphica TaxID=2927976 RepID=A0ABQ5PZN8_9BACT|nr:MFS transporter [Geothrix edaphica]GLH67639.1 MFS transporter [Geothrix edaphica]
MTTAIPGAFHPSTRLYRFTILIFISLLVVGSYFAYDSIGALATTLIKELHIDRATIGKLYAAYSVAAIAIVFFGGMLYDKLGPRKASLLFSCLVFLGAVVVAAAKTKWMLFTGRLIFGAGSESLIVVQSAIIARWFKGKEMAMAFGIALAISRLGTLFAFNTEELIADHFHSFRTALWAAALLCLFSVLCNLVFVVMDRHGEKVLSLPTAGAGDKIVFSDIKKFTSSYWFVVLLCVTFYSAIFPFTDLAADMFHDKWGLPSVNAVAGGFLTKVFYNFTHMFTTAPGVTSIVIAASMIFAPFAGGLVDRVGRRASLMVLGSLLLIPAHLLLGITHWNPIPMMVVLGAAFVLVPAAMWPSVPLVVEESRVGTAFGLMTAIQNLGLGLFPLLNGWLRDKTGTYTSTQIMFAGLGLLGLIFAFLLLRADKRHGGVLEAGSSLRG